MIDYSIEVYKKWHRTGFISVSLWHSAEKLKFEIATVGNDEKIKSLSTAYPNVYDVLTLLHADVHGQLHRVIPTLAIEGRDHGFVRYGGSAKESPPKSSVFKITDWDFDVKEGKFKSGRPSDNLRFSCGEFDGQVGDKGQIMPIWNKQRNVNFTQLKAEDRAQLFHRINTALIACESVAVAAGDRKPNFQRESS